MDTKETTQGVVKEIEALKVEKASILAKKENINADTTLLLDTISRTRSRIVPSPERIKRNIITMGAAATEDKKTIAQQEAKARDLQGKISALSTIEKVDLINFARSPSLSSYGTGLESLRRATSDDRERAATTRGFPKGTCRRERQSRLQNDRAQRITNEEGSA